MNGKYTAEYIHKVLQECFPTLAVEQIDPLGAGYNCEAFLINKQYVFKFPKNEKANDSLETEVRVLKFLEGKLPLSIPKIEFVCNESQSFPYRVIGYQQIKGRILTPQIYSSFTASEKEALAKSLADFLRALHAIPVPDSLKELEDDFVEGIRIDYNDIKKLVYDKLNDGAKEYTDNFYKAVLSDNDYKADRIALIHNDLSCNHIVIDEQENKAVGIIDFGDAAVTDVDLEFVYLIEDSDEEIGSDFGKRVLDYYCHKNLSLLMKKIKLKQAGESFEKILFGNSMGLEDMFYEGLSELQQKGE